MRRLFLVVTTTVTLVAPALGAKPVMNPQSPELKQCIQECMQKKDATAREACDVKCVQTDAARHPQNAEVPVSRGNRPQK